MSREPFIPDSLKSSLARMTRALEVSAPREVAAPLSPVARRRRIDLPTIGSAAGATALVTVAAVTGTWWLLFPALAVGSFGAVTWAQRFARTRPSRASTHAHIGMGASIAADAVVEPGASVEMGASVGAGAVLEPGATVEMGASVGAGAVVHAGAMVRMGASIGPRAVIESGAVISWGASVREDAVVEANSIIGAGASVGKGARVPANTRIWPGVDVRGSATGKTVEGAARPSPSAAAQQRPAEEPRLARVRAACGRLDAELRAAPESVREFLGDPAATVAALQHSCEDLLRRERALREESADETFARLDKERELLRARLGQETDEAIRRSLGGALTALEEQRRQRELLRRHADRLEAEQTRLLYTLEGMATQVMRLRSADAEAGRAPAAGLEASVGQLRAELEAIADSLEAVAQPMPPAAAGAIDRISEVGEEPLPHGDDRTRTRE